jgi:hypothetical protein
MLETRPEFGLRAPVCVSDWRQGQDYCSICKVQPADYVLDAVKEHGTRGFKQHFGVIAMELAHREAAAGCEATERVGASRARIEAPRCGAGGGFSDTH